MTVDRRTVTSDNKGERRWVEPVSEAERKPRKNKQQKSPEAVTPDEHLPPIVAPEVEEAAAIVEDWAEKTKAGESM